MQEEEVPAPAYESMKETAEGIKAAGQSDGAR